MAHMPRFVNSISNYYNPRWHRSRCYGYGVKCLATLLQDS
jgi:hypothetical protein